mmetsp:Transcript_14441/g.57560  ORF Transcript_14441/g.57560 Transcript_14441/m.57560 type:complete len:363 (-) Transcript_14441:1211-2299(-)
MNLGPLDLLYLRSPREIKRRLIGRACQPWRSPPGDYERRGVHRRRQSSARLDEAASAEAEEVVGAAEGQGEGGEEEAIRAVEPGPAQILEDLVIAAVGAAVQVIRARRVAGFGRGRACSQPRGTAAQLVGARAGELRRAVEAPRTATRAVGFVRRGGAALERDEVRRVDAAQDVQAERGDGQEDDGRREDVEIGRAAHKPEAVRAGRDEQSDFGDLAEDDARAERREAREAEAIDDRRHDDEFDAEDARDAREQRHGVRAQVARRGDETERGDVHAAEERGERFDGALRAVDVGRADEHEPREERAGLVRQLEPVGDERHRERVADDAHPKRRVLGGAPRIEQRGRRRRRAARCCATTRGCC